MESVTSSKLETTKQLVQKCLSAGDTTSVFQMLLIASLMCELDKTFGAMNELEEDAESREMIIKMLLNHDLDLFGVTFEVSTDVVPLEVLIAAQNANHDNN